MRKDMPNKISPSSDAIEHSASAVSISKINNLFKPSSSSTNKSSTSSQFPSNLGGKPTSANEVIYCLADQMNFFIYAFYLLFCTETQFQYAIHGSI